MWVMLSVPRVSTTRTFTLATIVNGLSYHARLLHSILNAEQMSSIFGGRLGVRAIGHPHVAPEP